MKDKVVKGKFVGLLEIGDFDLNVFETEDGLFYCYTSPEELSCFLYMEPAKNCMYEKPCRKCPAGHYFIELDGQVFPVHRLIY